MSELVTFDQWKYGSPTKKPTMLLFQRCNADDLMTSCDHPPGTHSRSTRRREADGSYFTASLAAYPAELCVAMAQVIADALFGLPQTVLILFSGKDDVLMNLAHCLKDLQIESVQVDILNTHLPVHDVADDDQWSQISQGLHQGVFGFLAASPPCRSFSEARTVRPGPPVLRDRDWPSGFVGKWAQKMGLRDSDMRTLVGDNLLTTRTAEAVSIMVSLQRGFWVEQPKPWKHELTEAPAVRLVKKKDVTEYVPRSITEQGLGAKVLQAVQGMKLTGAERYLKIAVQGSDVAGGFSEMLGLNLSLQWSAVSKLNPGMFGLLMSWFRKCEGTEDFDVTSIQVNCNMQSKPHRDTANAGMSGLVAFGDFQGGDLWYWPLDDGSPLELLGAPVSLNPRKLQFFDGRCYHATAPFTGTRYSLVFFTVRGAEDTSVEVVQEFVAAGASCGAWQQHS